MKLLNLKHFPKGSLVSFYLSVCRLSLRILKKATLGKLFPNNLMKITFLVDYFHFFYVSLHFLLFFIFSHFLQYTLYSDLNPSFPALFWLRDKNFFLPSFKLSY